MATIGTAYVQILPSAQGMQENLEKALGGEKTGKSLGEKIGAGMKKSLGLAGKAAAAGIAAAGSAVAALTTKAVQSYAEYEQLVGGAKKIFDEMDYSQIAADADAAYKTMNISASQYLEMINSVGATFSQTMGDQKGYETAKIGMQAIADYASGTGRNVDELNQKYAMITRSTSSYQSIADQFSGILPATSADFLAQAKAAGFLADKYKNLTEVPVAEYQEAVSKMLEKGVEDLGLAGNTVAETESTISGSLAAMKASWQNLLTGMASPDADVGGLIDKFIESVETAADNILPVAERALDGITKLITTGIQKLSPIIQKVISNNLPGIISAGASLLTALITGIIQALPQLVAALPQIFAAIVQAFADNWPAIKEAGIQLMIMIAQGIAEGLQWIGEKMMQLGSAIQSWLAQAWENVKAAAAQKWAEIGEAISTAVETIKTTFSEWVSAAGQKVTEFVEAVHSGIQQFLTQIGTWIQENLIQPAEDAIAEFVNIGQRVVDNIKDGISRAWDGLANWFNGIWQGLFGNRNVNVNVNASGNVGGYATGLDYVPYDEFPAILHKGEAVLTAAEADVWRRGGNTNGGMTIIQNIQSVPQSPVEIAAATAAMFEQARWAV